MRITEQMIHNKIAELIQHALDTNTKITILFIIAISALMIAVATSFGFIMLNKKLNEVERFQKLQNIQIEYTGDEVPQYEID